MLRNIFIATCQRAVDWHERLFLSFLLAILGVPLLYALLIEPDLFIYPFS